MTLIAAVAFESGIAIVSDTKVTYAEDAIQSARVFDLALPKIVLLRDQIAVAISGERPMETVRQLVQRREDDLGDIVDHLRGVKDAGFIVASTAGPSLWTVGDGKVASVPAGELALEGNPDAFGDLTRLYNDSQEKWGEVQALIGAMDQLAGPLGRHPSVGGYCLTAVGASEGFRFLSRGTTVAPRALESTASTPGELTSTMGITLPAGNSAWYQSVLLGGRGKTPGAVGIYVRQAKAGRLYAHVNPHEGETISASDVSEFAALALQRGQELQVVHGPLPLM
ncbi:hypothetical protein IFU08_09300 [Microbacterium sp. CFBP 8790]|uniref:hypothetical protein n=1 Tax=unclassified Microbacterium TaxID=2609290 RepID=UPI0017842873|nr:MULTISPECIES: hypothetical protein [unclassified Microbacterium]MBD8205182.1 hypothetical protein [Microbacterium sp. CFBP 8801]MBD8509763.1 hypothetical protein [Microbacterium sp. CFBP 8790]